LLTGAYVGEGMLGLGYWPPLTGKDGFGEGGI